MKVMAFLCFYNGIKNGKQMNSYTLSMEEALLVKESEYDLQVN